MPRICLSCTAVNDSAAAFCSRCGSRVDDAALKDARVRLERSTGYLPKDLTDLFLAPGTDPLGDQRLVTILFVDLVRSTEIVRALGGEDMADLLDELLDGIATAVKEVGGTVAELTGDGALCLFGTPALHEDDPERALQAALAIQRLAKQLRPLRMADTRWQPQVRIGIHTGTVVLRVVGHAHRLGYAAVGDAVHFTQRLQTAAAPGEILVSAVTRNLTASLFRFGDPRTPALKGFGGQYQTYPLLGESMSGDRRALGAAETTFVGRDADLAVVRSCVEDLAVGIGGVLTIWGEAGIGKSRLLVEARRLFPDAAAWLEGRGLSYAQNTPYSIIGQQIQRAAGMADADTERSARERLRGLVEQLCGPDGVDDVYPFLATAMGMAVTSAEESVLARYSSEALQKEILRSLRAVVSATTERGPLVLIFEDLHWSDRASIAALECLLPLVEEQPVLFVLVARPDTDGPSWRLRQKIETSYAHCHHSVRLGPLSAQASSDLATRLLGTDHLPADVRELFLEKAEGVPLFVEELARSLLEQGALRRVGESWRLTVAPYDLRLPETVQGIILARFDRLEPELKRILQAAAVLGPMVTWRVLSIVTGADTRLPIQLRDLQRLGFLRETRRTPERVYVFRHALIQDVAYQTMRQRTRRELHVRAGNALEEVFAERLSEHRGLIAEHFRRAEAWEKAVRYLATAGDESTRLHAHAEARMHYAKAAEALDHLPDTVDNRRHRVDTIVKRASVTYIAEPPEVNLERLREGEKLARDLVDDHGQAQADRSRLAWIDYWAGRVRYIAGDPPAAMESYRRTLAAARELGDSRLVVISSAMMGQAFTLQGRWSKAQRSLRAALPVLERSGDWREWCLASGYLGVSTAGRGEYSRGLSLVEAGVERARELRGWNLVASTGALLCAVHLMNERWDEVLRAAQAAIDASERSGEDVVLYIGLAFRAWAQCRLGDVAAAEYSMAGSRRVGEGLGQLLLRDWFAVAEADIAFCAARLDEALVLAEKAVQSARRVGGVFSEGLAHRVWAQVLASLDPPDAGGVEEHFATALRLLKSGGGDLTVAHTELALGYVRHALGDPAGAREQFDNAAARFMSFGLAGEADVAKYASSEVL